MNLHDHGPAFRGCSPDRHLLLVYGKAKSRKKGEAAKHESAEEIVARFYDWTVDGYCVCCGQYLGEPFDGRTVGEAQ